MGVSPDPFHFGAGILDALAHGRPLYDTATLRRYVTDDLGVLKSIRPDLVVGDFRLSLSVSARVAGIPYATITSAYWSPYARQRFPLPEHPLVGLLGVTGAQFMFDLLRPFVFAYHTRPMNRVRREFGLPSLGPDLRRVYTDADLVLYADPPELVPINGLPPNHRYLGPVLWSPTVDPPEWWETLPNDKPIIYVTMGSSGSGQLLAKVLEALSEIDCYAIVATAGYALGGPSPPNAFVTDYLSGSEATRLASLVVCNGGSPTSHQALAAGVPVLGIAGNMDQHLNMLGIGLTGAGLLLRSDRASKPAIAEAAQRLLSMPSYSEAAKKVAVMFTSHDAPRTFAQVTGEALQAPAVRGGLRASPAVGVSHPQDPAIADCSIHGTLRARADRGGGVRVRCRDDCVVGSLPRRHPHSGRVHGSLCVRLDDFSLVYPGISPLAGKIPLNSRQEFVYHVYQLFFLILFYPVMRSGAVPVPLMRLFYLALGARFGANTYSSGIIFDPGFVSIGENTIVGQHALLVPHVHEGPKIAHFPIRVGNNVTIGAHAVVMSEVVIGDGAIVAVGAIVPKGTHIGSGEVWGGVPARRIN